ncbi:hypothetical protein HI914_00279 [Erysiphe necator]|nr:hypothetical protein HI914_00279 [Erysiphe necator]
MQFSRTLILLLAPHLACSMWNKLTGSKPKPKPPKLKDGTYVCADGYKFAFAHVKNVVQFALPESSETNKFIYGPFKYSTDSSDKDDDYDFEASNSDYEWPIEWTTANWAHNLNLADFHYAVFNENGKIKKVYYYGTYHPGVEKSRRVNCRPTPELINVGVIYGPKRVTAKSPDSRISSPRPHNAGISSPRPHNAGISSPRPHNAGIFSPGPSGAGLSRQFKLVRRTTSRSNSFRLLRDN